MDKNVHAKKIYWITRTAIKFCFPYILVNVLLLAVSSALGIFVNVVNRRIINELHANIEAGEISTLFISFTIAYVGLYFINMASGFLGAFGQNSYRLNVNGLFQKIFMLKSEQTAQQMFFNDQFMERYSFVGNNTDRISSYIGALTSLFFSDLGVLVGAVTLFSIYEPLLILFCLLIGIILFFTNRDIARKEYQLDKEQVKENRWADYYKALLTDKAYAKEVRIYQYKRFIYKKWVKIYDKLRLERLTVSIERIKLQNRSAVIKWGARTLAVGILLLGIYNKKYDVGTFVMLFGLIDICYGQINNLVSTTLSGVYKDTKYLSDYYDFVMPISDAEIKGLKQPKTEDMKVRWGLLDSLEIHNVSYRYPNSSQKAVDNVSLKIKKGEIISILGYNGSGKTTLAKIMSGSIEPDSGQIMLNGNYLRQENRSDVFKYYGIAPQEFSKFSLQIRNFVGLGRIDKISEQNELALAYNKSGINSFIAGYAKKDQTVLGKEYDEEGIDLSGGEWQRLVIASTYMGRPEILLFDEPTASIDPLKEMELIENLRTNLQNKTAILISHRIGFARLADRIIMMQDGKLTEEGSHEELIAKNGYYAKLFYAQKELYQEEAVGSA